MLHAEEIALGEEPTFPKYGTPMENIEWLCKWSELVYQVPITPQVPQSASAINTPLVASNWRLMLRSYPHRAMAHFFLQGIINGFRIGFNPHTSSLKSATRNMQSALINPKVVEEYLAKERQAGRVIGPFPPSLTPAIHVSRFGVIPKSNQPNKWRLIIDLSHPKGRSVNDGIPKDLCSMTYITIDHAVSKILELGPGTQLAKIDVRSAFRLVPVHPADRHLLAMEWKNELFIDTCLPFGLRSAPKLFNILADLLEWICYEQGVSHLCHYLDDFLTMGQPDSMECGHNLQLLIAVCQGLGIPLAVEKVEGPSTNLEFLGIQLDTVRMEARLPEEKLRRISSLVQEWLPKRNATKREVLSLVGLLQHAAKVVQPGRTFARRMYWVAAKLKEMDFYTRLNREFRSDLYWWHIFLNSWNGMSFFKIGDPFPPPDIVIQSDASGCWGCAAFCNGKWLQWKWPQEWAQIAIMPNELVPIVLSCAVWGPSLSRKRVLFQCDNAGVVAAIRKGSAKEALVMHLLRSLWFFAAYFDIHMYAIHIPGACNVAADQLSRYNMSNFFHSNPQANLLPTPLPLELLQIVSMTGPDWTSQAFGRLFSDTISRV